MGRTILIILVAIIIGLVLAYVLGPRVSADTTLTFDPAAIGDDPAAYLAGREADVAGIREGLQKEIVWAGAENQRTPVSIVYLHGFSASKGEVRPLPDQVAESLGANLFYTRFTGHGRDGPAMASASVRDWVGDAAEALAIGRLIGERVVIMATSTGGGIATWALAQPELREDVAGAILISPNYQIKAGGSWVLTMPWGGLVANLLTGGERGFEPRNELQAKYWTTRYPTAATLPLAAMTRVARDTDAGAIGVPALFVFSDRDQVVDPATTRSVAGRWGGPAEIVNVDDSEDPSHHVIAGDAFSPSTTDRLADRAVDWISALSD